MSGAGVNLYGIRRADIDYILSAFQGVRDEDGTHGTGQTRQLILEALDRLGL